MIFFLIFRQHIRVYPPKYIPFAMHLLLVFSAVNCLSDLTFL